MKEQLKIIEKLTQAQKTELDKDIQELSMRLQNEPDFQQGHVKDTNINMNLLDEVYLNVTVEFGEVRSDKVNGRVTEIFQYPSKAEYSKAINS